MRKTKYQHKHTQSNSINTDAIQLSKTSWNLCIKQNKTKTDSSPLHWMCNEVKHSKSCAGDICCTSWDVTSSSSSHWLLSLHTCPLSSLAQRPSELQWRRTTPCDTAGRAASPQASVANLTLVNADNLATVSIHALRQVRWSESWDF